MYNLYINLKLIAGLIFILAMLGLFLDRRPQREKKVRATFVIRPSASSQIKPNVFQKKASMGITTNYLRFSETYTPSLENIKLSAVEYKLKVPFRLERSLSITTVRKEDERLREKCQRPWNDRPRRYHLSMEVKPQRLGIRKAFLCNYERRRPSETATPNPRISRACPQYAPRIGRYLVNANLPQGYNPYTPVFTNRGNDPEPVGASVFQKVYGQPSPGQSKPQVRNNEQYFLTFICLEVAFLAGFLLLLTNAYFYDSIQGAVFSLFLLILLAADSAIALALIHKAISETSPLSKDA